MGRLTDAKTAEEAHAIASGFLHGLQELTTMAIRLGALPIIAGCYCCNDYSAIHYNTLKETDAALDRFNVPVLHFLSAIDDGNGQWRSVHRFSDVAHPNRAGHLAIFEAIDQTLFAPEKIKAASKHANLDKMCVSRL